VALGLTLGVFCQRIALAEHSPHAEISSAELANDERARTINNRLESERSTLEKLIELQKLGHATWLEVAQKKNAVASLEAQQKSAVEFAFLIRSLRQRLARMDQHDDELSSVGDWHSALLAITLQIAAARAQAKGEMRAAQVMLKRQQFRAGALQQLLASNPAV